MKFSKSQLFKLKKALLKLAEIQTEEGVMLITDTDELTAGVEVFVDSEEGLVPATDGTYNYNGQVITVEGGVITDITVKPVEEETPAEEVVETEEEEKPTEEQPTEEETPAEEEEKPTEEVEQEITEEVVEVAEEINDETKEDEVDVEALKSKIAELEALVEELKAKLAEPVAESVEEEMKKQEKKNSKKPEMNYMAAIKKAREIQITRK